LPHRSHRKKTGLGVFSNLELLRISVKAASRADMMTATVPVIPASA